MTVRKKRKRRLRNLGSDLESKSYLTLDEVQRAVVERTSWKPCRPTIFRWCQSGKLKSVRIAGRIMVKPTVLDGFLEARPVSERNKGAK